MGYDMRMIDGQTEEEQAAGEAAADVFRAACKERDKYERGSAEYMAAQAEVDRAYDQWDDLADDYFRLNISGMGWCRDFMLERGMAYEARGLDFPHFEWPEREDFKTGEEYDAAQLAAEERYTEISEPILEYHPEGGDTIPTFKLGSNDGWHVTEAECAAAVAAARASDGSIPTYLNQEGEHEVVRWWEKWVDYLDRASQRGGFRVH